ncbi:hypothetical protein V8C34DRAFT_285057 [Trichoderma compactum]
MARVVWVVPSFPCAIAKLVPTSGLVPSLADGAWHKLLAFLAGHPAAAFPTVQWLQERSRCRIHRCSVFYAQARSAYKPWLVKTRRHRVSPLQKHMSAVEYGTYSSKSKPSLADLARASVPCS